MKKLFFAFTLVILLTSCNSERKKQEKDVELRLNHIENLIAQDNFNDAKIALDSIHILYPRMVESRRTAKALEDTIIRRENLRNIDYFKSILPEKKHLADSIRKNFRLEKNETYQTVGNYVYKNLVIESNVDRIYLRAYVDESADFFFISNFTADYKLEHTSVMASVGDSYAETETIPLSSPMNHRFEDGGKYFEVVTFKNEYASTVPWFVAENIKERIKITLQGNRKYAYYLNDTEKKALNETYNLWVIMKDVKMLENEIQRAEFTIERINKLYESPTGNSIDIDITP